MVSICFCTLPKVSIDAPILFTDSKSDRADLTPTKDSPVSVFPPETIVAP